MNHLMIQRYLQQKTGVASLDKLLNNYHQHLVSKRITPHSIRLAMTPAVKLLSLTSLAKKERMDQTTLNKILKSTPGQYAAIYGFVMFCKNTGERIDMPSKDSIGNFNNRLELERELIGHIKRGDSIFDNAKFRAVALAYFHRMPLKTAKTLISKSHTLTLDNHGLNVHYVQNEERRIYSIPKL